MRESIEWNRDAKLPITCPACNQTFELPVSVLADAGSHECPHCGTVVEIEWGSGG